MPGGWQDVGGMYWYNAIDLACSAVNSRPPLISIVISMKMTFLDSFVDVHLRPIALMRVLNETQFDASTSGSGSWSQIPRPYQ